MKVVNLYAGPGTGKSTTAAALFAELKYLGLNVELVTEYAKDLTWEKRGPKVFKWQEYIFAKQHSRLLKLDGEVSIAVTDSPMLLSTVYAPADYKLTEGLLKMASAAYSLYDNLDIFLTRSTAKKYNPKGRNQTEEEAQALDLTIKEMLHRNNVPFVELEFSRDTPRQIIDLMIDRKWIEFKCPKCGTEYLEFTKECDWCPDEVVNASA